MEKRNEVLELSFEFALDIIHYCEELENNKKYVLSHQLLKSGTSIEANGKEAQNAESIMDFVHKLKIAAKEAEETEYWLQLCLKSKTYPSSQKLIDQIGSIKKLLNAIIAATKRKLTN
ncbi:four helix bundle protein [Microbacter margulisiae]|uniref:Four helix bundle protein n=1 Tax=Microbacter margulisiae TaxID=1350067 RepID=A0A7W5DN53_9PORP|nr:four helix bundle protein [Microbacter margulisiae]MBB3185997.1 four helix bundle protein [Microbacter margulisiae]